MPYCPFTKHGITIRSDGNVAPCCAWRDQSLEDKVYYNEPDKWKEKFARIGRELEQGWPAGCIECKVGEESGKSSMRSRAVEGQFDGAEGIEYWDFKLSTTCNLACKMCGAHSSSTWKREALKYEVIGNTFHGAGKGKSKVFKEQDGLKIEHFYPYLLNAKTVKFTGGEPFLIPEVRECLEYLVESEAAPNILIHFITNGTQDLETWMPLFKHFKRVWLTVSVDAKGELYEYIRQGASWEQVSNNLIKIRKGLPSNMKLIVTPLPMSLNYGKIKDLTDWCDEHNIEWNESIECINPPIMSPRALNDPELKEKLIQHLTMLDKIYGTDYRKVINIE